MYCVRILTVFFIILLSIIGVTFIVALAGIYSSTEIKLVKKSIQLIKLNDFIAFFKKKIDWIWISKPINGLHFSVPF